MHLKVLSSDTLSERLKDIHVGITSKQSFVEKVESKDSRYLVKEHILYRPSTEYLHEVSLS